VVSALGAGKRPPVVVTINGKSYRSSIAVMGGQNLIGVSTANREFTGVAAGDTVEVDVELDTQPRIVEVPDDLRSFGRRTSCPGLLCNAELQRTAPLRRAAGGSQDLGDAGPPDREGRGRPQSRKEMIRRPVPSVSTAALTAL